MPEEVALGGMALGPWIAVMPPEHGGASAGDTNVVTNTEAAAHAAAAVARSASDAPSPVPATDDPVPPVLGKEADGRTVD